MLSIMQKDISVMEYIIKWAFLWCLVLSSSFFNYNDGSNSIGLENILFLICRILIVYFILVELLSSNNLEEIMIAKMATIIYFGSLTFGNLFGSYHNINFYEIFSISPLQNAIIFGLSIIYLIALTNKLSGIYKLNVLNITGMVLMMTIALFHMGLDIKLSKENVNSLIAANQENKAYYYKKELTFFGYDTKIQKVKN